MNKQKKVISTVLATIFAAAAFFSGAAGALAATQYTITDLGTFGGQNSYARGINASGQIVGQTDLSTGESHAFSYQNGTMSNLGTLGGSYSDGKALNDIGQLAGNAVKTDGNSDAFLYQNGTMQDLGSLDGRSSAAYGINNSGQVVGDSLLRVNNVDKNHAFLYQNGGMSDIGTLDGVSSHALGVNNSGVIAGYLDGYASGDPQSFIYQNGAMKNISTSVLFSAAYAINDANTIVGAMRVGDASGPLHAYSYKNGTTTDIGTLGGTYGVALGINSKGQIVGDTNDASSTYTAFLYDQGQMVDLYKHIPADSGWTSFAAATGINDSGQIIGYGNINGKQHAFLLSPVVPATTGAVVVTKTAQNGDGSFGIVGDNGLGSTTITTANGTGSVTFAAVVPGTYHISETQKSGWTQTNSTCNTVTVFAGATSTCMVTNTVVAPSDSLSANPQSLTAGSSTKLTWSSTNATLCSGTNFSTGGATSGNTSVSPATTTTYSITCNGTGGSVSTSTTVTVTQLPSPPAPAGTTWNPSDKSSTVALSNGNLTATSGGSTNPGAQPQTVRSTTAKSSGKVYVEIGMPSRTHDWAIGIANKPYNLASGAGVGADNNSVGFYPVWAVTNGTTWVYDTQALFVNNTMASAVAYQESLTSQNGDTVGMAIDFTNHLVWMTDAKMRAQGKNWNNSTTANPATGTGGVSFSTETGPYYLAFNDLEGGGVATANFGTGTYVYGIPTGYASWNGATTTPAPTTTWNPGKKSTTITLSNNNLTASSGGSTSPGITPQTVLTTTTKTAGKAYYEIKMPTRTHDWSVGLANQSYNLASGAGIGGDTNSLGFYPVWAVTDGSTFVRDTQAIFVNNTEKSSVPYQESSTSQNGDTVSVAVDFTAHLIWITDAAMRAQGHPWNNSASANPATGTGGISFSSIIGPYYAAFNDLEGGGAAIANFGAATFTYALPSGFTAWDSQ